MSSTLTDLHLTDLFDMGDLTRAVDDGFVRRQHHPDPALGLTIWNYTDVTQYQRHWTDVTLTCRGLITDASGRVVARPYAKFFNYGEAPGLVIHLDTPALVTDKLDGCFPRGTALNLWNGGTITIDEVVTKRLPVTLVGMDEQGNLVPTVVTGWHHNGRKDHWLDVEVDCPVSRVSGAGGHANRLRVTVNHHIWVNGEYRPACEIQPGDTVITQTWQPSEEVVRMIRASLLGDGCLTPSATKPHQARYQEPHSDNQADYVEALRKVLGGCAVNRSDTRSGHGSRLLWAGSREYEALGDLRRDWYPGGVKRVPSDLSWMDDYAVAKWLMDDGHRQKFKAQADRISFATHSFPEEDVRRLGERLREMYGISYHLVRDRGWTLVVNSGRRQEIHAMWRAIAPHVHPSMRYKLPERYQDAPYTEPAHGCEIITPREVKVLSVALVAPTKRNFPFGRTGFDITTTTHNYMARGVLVHNSLGILYPDGDGYAIATRGSFASEQARHATRVWRERYAHRFAPAPGITYLFEIIYPGNRIVVDYNGLDDLVLLGGVEIATGTPIDAETIDWPGPKVTTFAYATLREALSAPPRPGAEGFVVRLPDADHVTVKIKQADYIALHRILTQVTARTVWEFCAVAACKHLIDRPNWWGSLLGMDPARAEQILDLGPDWLATLVDGVPDEFHAWLRSTIDGLHARVQELLAELTEFAELARFVYGSDRKAMAAELLTHEHCGAIFHLLDGKDLTTYFWRHVYPEPGTPWVSGSEDA